MNKQRGALTIGDLGVVMAITSVICSGFWFLFRAHDPAGTALTLVRAFATTYIFDQESMTQNVKNHYIENIEDGIMVEESKKQLQRLKWNEQLIQKQKITLSQQLGIDPPPAPE